MAARIMLAEDDDALRMLLQTVLEDNGFEVYAVPNGSALVQAAHQVLPDLLLVDVMMPVMSGLEAIRQLRHDTRTAHLPMLLLTALDGSRDAVAGFEHGADDYITKPFDNDVLIARIKANLLRTARASVNSPLTGLAGNMLIGAEVNHRLGLNEPFALLYIDLNNFKAFNDAYGFARGDRVIRLLADLLRELKERSTGEGAFIGHIGGDDFVALVHPHDAVRWAQRLITQFDQRIPHLYDAQDSARGYLVGVDRFGTPHRFPLTSISLGVVNTTNRNFTGYTEVAAVAAEAKGRAKKQVGSHYVFDERQPVADGAPPIVERRGQPPLIIVISDDDDLQQQWTAWATEHGYRSTTLVATPSFEQLAALTPTLVLLDLRCPNCWNWLTNTRVAYPALPIVALAETSDEQPRAIQTGATVCFVLPAVSELVTQTVTDLLRLPLPPPMPMTSTTHT